MKKMLTVLSLLVTQASFAAISNSTLEARQADLIEASITEQCGYFRDLTEVSTSKTIISVDQGIKDIKFVSVFEGLQRMDQNIFDKFEIVVESEYSDMYDHASKDWGVYSVSSVKCTMNN